MPTEYTDEEIISAGPYGCVYVLASDYAALEAMLSDEVAENVRLRSREVGDEVGNLLQEVSDLKNELARVKAESLRVVVDGEACDIVAAKSQYVTDEDGELWECHPEPADDGREVRSILTGCGGYFADTIVQPVRLERWEANDVLGE